MNQERILMEFGLPYFQHARDCLWGVLDYAQRHCPKWKFMTDPFDFFQAFQPGFIPPEKANGAFLWLQRRNKTLDALQKNGIPAINLTLPDDDLGIPCVTTDDRAIGVLAGRHLSLPLVSETIYVGPEFRRSSIRLEGFRQALKEAGKPPPHVLLEPEELRRGSAQCRLNHIKAFLKKLRPKRPSRLGVFAFSDSFGHAVAEACYHMNLTIPNEVAVIGCDNEALICSLSRVQLSSIPPNSRNLGMMAAKNLHSLMRGEKIPDLTLLEPMKIVERLSSSRLVVEDPVIAKALGIIQEKAGTGLRVCEILEYLPISRRNFEIRFRATVGCSPFEEILRVRLELAFAKLSADEETNAKIAFDCGFSSATHFEQAFRKHTGHSPSYYRKAKKASGSASAR